MTQLVRWLFINRKTIATAVGLAVEYGPKVYRLSSDAIARLKERRKSKKAKGKSEKSKGKSEK